MFFSSKKLIGLPVETKSGVNLGNIFSFDFDPDHHSIVRYYVRRKGIIKGFTAGDLIVHKNQVLSLSDKKMVVEDLVIRDLVRAKAKLAEAT